MRSEQAPRGRRVRRAYVGLLSLLGACAGACSASDSGASAPSCDHPAAAPVPARDADRVELVDGEPTGCPTDPLTGALSGTCVYEVECQSGTRQFALQAGWTATALSGACDEPFDTCPALKLWCSQGHWTHAGGTDEPHVCDWAPPARGQTCSNPPMAYDQCGYWCGGTTGGTWTVASCGTSAGAATSTWSYDGACPCP